MPALRRRRPSLDRYKGPVNGIAGSFALVVVVGLLGPSAAQPPLPDRRGWSPPWHLPADLAGTPSPWLVSLLLWLAIALAVVGLLAGLRAIARGWLISKPHGITAGIGAVAAMVAIPPMGSADVLVYAAYGRIAATGGDPYATTAADLAATGDPIGRAVEAPWQDTPSIYGPAATAQQWLAAQLAGGSTQATVWLLAALGALAYVGTGVLLLRLASDEPAAQSRVLLLWWLNPLLLYEVVNGAHVDGFGIVWAVAALAALRRSPLAAGALVGVAIAIKLSFGLYALALAWPLRRSPARLAHLGAGALAVVAVAYLPYGLHALDQAREASRLVSFGTPSRLLVGPLEAMLPNDTARTLIAALAWAALAVLAWLLWRPSTARHDPTPEAVRAAAVLGFAWLLTAAYSLPWYDVVAWAPFAVLAASSYDILLTARTAIMAAAYVPGRVVDLPDVLETVTRNVRGTLAPVAGIALLVFAARIARQPVELARPPGFTNRRNERPGAGGDDQRDRHDKAHRRDLDT